MLKIKNEIECYEKDGAEIQAGQDSPILIVESHWNRADFVVVKFGKTELTVAADELMAAIKNAINTARW